MTDIHFEGLRVFHVDEATTLDELNVARGSFRNVEDNRQADGQERYVWMELTTGDWAWINVVQANASIKGGEGASKGKGEGRFKCNGERNGAVLGAFQRTCNWCGKARHTASDCEDNPDSSEKDVGASEPRPPGL